MVGTELFLSTLQKDALGVSVKGSQLMQQMPQPPEITALGTHWSREFQKS